MIAMFTVNGKTYTVRFNQEKIKDLDPNVSASILAEIFATFDGQMSDQTMRTLFILGLEEEKTGVQVPFDEAEDHYNKLIKNIDNQRAQRLRDFISERFEKGLPKFFDYLKKGDEVKDEGS